MNDKLQEVVTKLLIRQSNLILDALAGKISILQATAILYSKTKDIDKLRNRLRKIKGLK